MRILFITILLLTGTYTIYSQEFGLQAGVRINTSGIEYAGVDVKRKLGFDGGAFYRHPVGVLTLNVRVAMLYFNHEFSLENSLGNNSGITYHFVENNLKLPLTIEWHPMSWIVKPFLQAGVYTSYCLSGKIKDSDSSTKLKYGKSGHRFDYGAIVGIGVYLTSSIALNANYEYGFADRNLVLGDQFVSVNNRGYSVVINYLF